MLNTILGPKRRADYAGDGFWGLGSGWGMWGRVRTQANVEVGEDTALTYAACWRATQILSSSEAGVPLNTYYHLPGGNKEEARDHRLFHLLRDIPNPDMDAMAFREGRTMHQVNWGQGFAEIQRDRQGDVVALWPIHPSRVKPVRREETDQDGRPLLPTYRYRVRNNDGSEVVLRADEMLHVPGSHSEDGVWGKGVVSHARESIGLGLATERHGATYFGSGARPPGVIFANGLKDAEARKDFRAEWKQIHGSPDSGEIAILPTDAKYQQLAFPPEDSQFLATRVQNVREVARWYGVPSHLLGDLEKASYNSIEQLGIDFVVYSLFQWLKRWEGQIRLKLIRKEERHKVFVQHDIAELVAGDRQTLYNCFAIGLMNGFLCINDCRRMLNMNSIGKLGDQYRVPLNTTTLEMAGLPPPPTRVSLEGLAVPGKDKAVKPVQAPTPPLAGQMPETLLQVPNRRQQHDFDCGAACTASVAAYFGVDEGMTEEQFIEELGTKQVTKMENDGTRPSSIIEFFSDRGLIVTSGSGWTLDDLRHYWSQGQPVIVPIQDYGTAEAFRKNESGHYVVVVGLWGGLVFVQDPSASNAEAGGRDKDTDSVQEFGVIPIDEEVFMSVWHDRESTDSEAGKLDIQYGIAVGRGHAPPPPPTVPNAAPQEPDENEPEATPAIADSDSRDRGTTTHEEDTAKERPPATDRVAEAARTVLEATLARLLTKEANAVARFADRPDFEARLEEFHAKHVAVAADALSPLTPVLALAGIKAPAEDLAHKIVAQSRTLLLMAYNQGTRPQMRTRLEAWASQARAMTREVMM